MGPERTAPTSRDTGPGRSRTFGAQPPMGYGADMAAADDTPARTLRPRGQRTRQRLLDAGAAVFAERGYYTARVDDVVRAASASHGTFYLYFANKEELFRALAAEVVDAMTALADEFPDLDGPDVARSLHSWIDRYAALAGRSGAVVRVWADPGAADSEVGRVGADLARAVTGRIAARITPVAPDLDARVAATAVLAMLDRTVAAAHVAGDGAPDRTVVVDTLVRMVRTGLLGA